mmetsp:Transcript_3682/g.9624  ORF Transcript_3682/g.9624 Transcript_3682/m.9624 type:complete len:247 (+) Transcript_3682:785-1525(+)
MGQKWFRGSADGSIAITMRTSLVRWKAHVPQDDVSVQFYFSDVASSVGSVVACGRRRPLLRRAGREERWFQHGNGTAGHRGLEGLTCIRNFHADRPRCQTVFLEKGVGVLDAEVRHRLGRVIFLVAVTVALTVRGSPSFRVGSGQKKPKVSPAFQPVRDTLIIPRRLAGKPCDGHAQRSRKMVGHAASVTAVEFYVVKAFGSDRFRFVASVAKRSPFFEGFDFGFPSRGRRCDVWRSRGGSQERYR